MSPEEKIAAVGAGIIVLTLVVVIAKFLLRRAPLRLRKRYYQKKWKQLHVYCKNKETWPKALQAADNLLDRALIKRGFKGKNMGERIVSAQRKFSDNDSLWFGHKLVRKLEEDPDLKLREKDVKEALLGIGQALKDLGAL